MSGQTAKMKMAPEPAPRPSREVPVEPRRTALLVIDVQNYCCHPDGAEFAGLDAAGKERRYGYYFDRLERVVYPNMRRLQDAVRAAGGEVVFTVIESLTQDGRDRGLDYKISGFNVPRGSWDAKVIDQVAPVGDEIVIPKTASSVFNSTNIEYVLRNLGVAYLIVVGTVTDQCVDTAVRDACDKGFLVTLVGDCCATYSAERHEASMRLNRGYCRQVSIDELIAELAPPARATG